MRETLNIKYDYMNLCNFRSVVTSCALTGHNLFQGSNSSFKLRNAGNLGFKVLNAGN